MNPDDKEEQSSELGKIKKLIILVGGTFIVVLLLPLLPLGLDNLSWAPSPAAWQAYTAVLGLIIATIAAGLALIQLYSHWAAVDEQRRPYVIADFHFRGGALVLIEIKNISASPAYDITFEVDHPFESNDSRKAKTLTNYFSSPGKTCSYALTLLAPGRRTLYSLGHAAEIKEKERRLKYTVTLTYSNKPKNPDTGMSGPKGFLSRGGRQTWVEKNPLDLAQWWTIAERDEHNWLVNESKEYLKLLTEISNKLTVKNKNPQD